MIKIQRSRVKARHTRIQTRRRPAGATGPAGNLDKSFDRHAQLREFMRAMSVELSDLAYKNGFDALAVIFDMAREAAETELSLSDEHLRRP